MNYDDQIIINPNVVLDHIEKMNYDDQIIINPNVVFYHIEKCMGSSIEIMLYNYFINIYPEKDIFIPEKNNYKHFCLEEKYYFEKNNFKVILSHISFNEKYLTSLFSETSLSITSVRNPIERIISHYYYFDYKKYNKCMHMLNDNEIKEYLVLSNIILWRLSGNTNNLTIAKQNLKQINCILIMDIFNDEKTFFENYLNNKFKSINTLIKLHYNKTEYNEIIGFNKEKDIEIILNNQNLIIDEIELYNYILNMTIEERFK